MTRVLPRSRRGFTLVELMVAVVVIAILASVAVPGFSNLIQSSTLTTAANDLVLNLHTARSVAGRQGRDTLVCFWSDCPVCADRACEAVLYQGVPSLSNGQLQSRSVKPLIFGYLGVARIEGSTSPYTGLVADIYSTRIASRNHRCVYMAAGSALSTCSDSVNCDTGAPHASCL